MRAWLNAKLLQLAGNMIGVAVQFGISKRMSSKNNRAIGWIEGSVTLYKSMGAIFQSGRAY
jgi:hypothetical protein